MAELSERAANDIRALRDDYEAKDRFEAATNLVAAVRRALQRIDRHPDEGLASPRPYPDLARAGERWIKDGRYWFAYTCDIPAVVLAVFYDQADLPRRERRRSP